MDRRSVRRTKRRMLDPRQLQYAVDLRHQRLHLRHIAQLLRAPFSTVARALSRLGLGRLRTLNPKPPVQRYEWERPGDLIHIDVKSPARFRKVGHRITGDRQRHSGQAEEICRHRARVYEQARQRQPRRWSRSTRCWHQPGVVLINPPPHETEINPATLVMAA
ncbi:hypothetical protein [Synechococcus sp. GFB01]|uniref:hypothetical protein n=1 Tax=Synechococcus sp. GFB01 TaxID=1662190 RepID=UPI001F2DD99E|nr:hypothetical protein [Synechococcus sp. GFB01]